MRHLTPTLLFAICWLTLSSTALTQTPGHVASGNQQLASAIDALEWHVSIAARIRHQSRLDEHTLMGSGNYWQLRAENKRKSRWEMQTQITGKTASFVQVFDGNHLWTDRKLPSGREVRRLDVSLLHSRLDETNSQTQTDSSSLVHSAPGQGGLTQMLADLMQRYEFAAPRQTQLNGLAVNALIGRWRPEQLAAMGVELEQPDGDPTTTWPKQLPHHVLVLLGRDKLFPYVIEHRRASDAPLLKTVAGLRPTRDPLLRYEIFEVQFAHSLDPSLFEFKTGDLEWTDETALVVEKLRAEREAATESVARRTTNKF